MNIGQLFKEAKDNLQGNWANAIVGNILIGIISGIGLTILIMFTFFTILISVSNSMYDESIGAGFFVGIFLIIVFSVFIMLLRVGYQFSILDMKDNGQLKVAGFFSILKQKPLKVIGLIIMIAIFVFLWGLLFMIPGIIKMYSYSQSLYILKENPEKGILECISESKRLMKGNKLTLFGVTIIVMLITAIPNFIILTSSGIFTTFAYSGSYTTTYSTSMQEYGALYYLSFMLLSIIWIFLTPLLDSLYASFYRKLVPLEAEEENNINENIWTTSNTVDNF